MKKKICAIIAISCAILILGTAGSSDLNKIGFNEATIRCTIALPILLISMKIGGFFE